jgi:hypothetical protein
MKSNERRFAAIVEIGLGLMMALNMVVTDSQYLAVAGEFGCHTVVLEAHVTGVFPNFSGVITGDLEGSVDVVLDGEQTMTGVALHGSGEDTWVITGGTIPELVGGTLNWMFTFVQQSPPGQGSTTSLISGTYRITDGAEGGNLTFHAIFDASVFPFVADSEYRGVVCPYDRNGVGS